MVQNNWFKLPLKGFYELELVAVPGKTKVKPDNKIVGTAFMERGTFQDFWFFKDSHNKKRALWLTTLGDRWILKYEVEQLGYKTWGGKW